MKICAMCGNIADCEHHLIFGMGLRELADQDGLTIPLCNDCHTTGRDRIHGNVAAERLSKMLGQALWESKYGDREQFRERYGRSYL